MRKMTVAILVMSFLILLSVVVPALASPAEKVPATLTIARNAPYDSAPEKIWTTDGGIRHVQGVTRRVDYDPVKKNVTLAYDGKVIVGEIQAFVDIMFDTRTRFMINHYHKWTITFPVQTGVTVAGSFEGTNIWIQESGTPLQVTGHAVLQGTGGFEGQTLKLAMDLLANGNTKWYGYLMTR